MNSRILFGISLAKSSLYSLEGLIIPIAQLIANWAPPRIPILENPALFFRAQKLLRELLWRDSERIAAGLYPAAVLSSAHPIEDAGAHFLRLPQLLRDAIAFQGRKKKKTTKKFSAAAKANAKGAPEYYVRNFHFQEDGYLSPGSAAIYDHQVELLFAGAADAMRRMVIAPIKEQFGQKKDLRILELGCGTGSTTRFLAMAFPNAQIRAVDLSAPYLQEAQKRPECGSVEFAAANAERLSFKDKSFDAVVSVFLFHELPLEVRKKILREGKRLLKTNGLFVFADSLQLNDVEGMNEPLLQFPREFHEPFYPNYIRNPMESLLQQAGFETTFREFGFFTKAVAARVAKRKSK